MGLAATGRRNGRREEILEFKQAARRGHVFVRSHTADRGFVHLDHVSHLLEVQRTKMGHTMREEGILLPHDLARHFQDGAGALVERLDQPGCVRRAFGDEFLFLVAHRQRAHFGIIGLVHQHAWQGF